MSETKKIAITRAMTLLVAAGAQYHIWVDDCEWGQPRGKGPKRRKARAPNGVSYAPIFTDVLLPMQPGDVAVLTPYDSEGPTRLRKNAQSYAIHKWGAGNNVTLIRNDGKVEVMRIA